MPENMKICRVGSAKTPLRKRQCHKIIVTDDCLVDISIAAPNLAKIFANCNEIIALLKHDVS
jgi:hypothetical protein